MSIRLYNILSKHSPFRFNVGYHPFIRSYCSFDVKSGLSLNTDTFEKIEGKAEKLCKENRYAAEFLDICGDYKLNKSRIVSAMEHVPEITSFTRHSIRYNIEQLIALGFEPGQISKIIAEYPHILNFDDNVIDNTFEVWRSCNLFQRFLWVLFTNNPWLFAINDEVVKFRIRRLQYFMNNRINRVTRLLELCPDLLSVEWENVEENFDYVLKQLRYNEKEISTCTVLVKPLMFIKIRFIFLERAGMYVRPKLKDEDSIDAFINPPLKLVIDSSDESFVKNVAKVSVDEFKVFKKLIAHKFRNVHDEDYDLS